MPGLIAHSDMASAPVLHGLPGSLRTLLKAVLVDGFGTFPGLGWTTEFDNPSNNSIVFRMGSGTRTFLRISNNINYYGLTRCYKTMSDIDTGISPCPELTTTNNTQMSCSSSPTTSPRSWVIIGDSSGFYFLPGVESLVPYSSNTTATTRVLYPHYFGDYVPFDPSNKNTFVMVCQSTSPTSNVLNATTSNSPSTGMYLMNGPNNEYGSVKAGLQSSSSSLYYFGLGPNIPSLGDRTIYSRPIIHATEQPTPYIILGYLPGLHCPMGSPPLETPIEESAKYYITNDGTNDTNFDFLSKSTTSTISHSVGHRFMINLGEKFRL